MLIIIDYEIQTALQNLSHNTEPDTVQVAVPHQHRDKIVKLNPKIVKLVTFSCSKKDQALKIPFEKTSKKSYERRISKFERKQRTDASVRLQTILSHVIHSLYRLAAAYT